ncbi:hypothetical protein Scep_021221 [Stephania cephalantha]|uniref:Anthranilate phosphoribosyltransferase n=1 Tax=Stephania cephalantha TaxID=152367 RepID=A0AAP0F5Q3_9MAGN
MRALKNPNPTSPIHQSKPTRLANLHNQLVSLSTRHHHHHRLVHSQRRRRGSIVRAALNSPWATIDELGLLDAGFKNPSVSTSYRVSEIPRPNRTVLEAQARVCTGPTQTKPLTEDQAYKVLDTILRSVKGELKDEDVVSKAQLGAFFGAMTIRANAFPEATQWSEGEKRAIDTLWPELVQVLPHDIIFIADPEGTIMGQGSSIGPNYVGNGTTEMRLVGALREVLAGGHLGFEEVKGVLSDVLPLEDVKLGKASDSLLSAFLIGQRMNRETDSELKAYCLAFDEEHGSVLFIYLFIYFQLFSPYDLADWSSFNSTLIAVVKSCYGESCLLHGVEWMPPKGGVTEEQMLSYMGANTQISPSQAKKVLEDEDAGFAYISLREARPSLYSLVALREHIKKRPPIATSEKVQQFVRASGREAIVAGFYHEGYEDSLLMLMRRRGVHAGLVVKGEEGALSMTTRLRPENASRGLPVNYCSGFRSKTNLSVSDVDGVSREHFNMEVNAKDYGFDPTDTPRTDRSVVKNIELGLAALNGEKGPAYDRIVLNAAMVDHLLGCDGAADISSAIDRAKEAIDSGKALNKILNYIKITHKLK